ncbi:MAG: hypothetical protein ACE5F8_08255, partial [Woeseiaceae bacterium]
TTFHSIFLWLVNDTADDRIKVHLYWNPESTAAGDMNEARITKILGPYETLCISDGWRLGQGHNPWITGGGGHAQIEGYVENAGDVNKIKVIGYVDEVTQSGVA